MYQGIQDKWVGNDNIKTSGCYFFSLAQKAFLEHKLTDDPVDNMEKWYRSAVAGGIMRKDCFVYNAGLLFNLITGGTQFKGVHDSKTPMQGRWNVACLKKPEYMHFVLHFADNNGIITQTWDPKDPIRPAAKDYKLDCYKILETL